MAQYGNVAGGAVNFGVENQDALGGVITGLNGVATVLDPNAAAAIQNMQGIANQAANGQVNTAVQEGLQMAVQNQAPMFDPLAMGSNAAVSQPAMQNA